jgi:hypothetical protein
MNNLKNIKTNSADPDQMPRMCWMIWIYTVCPCHEDYGGNGYG